MSKSPHEQRIADLILQNRAWEMVATRAIETRVQAERLLAASHEREQELNQQVQGLQGRVNEMGELVATTIGQVNQVTDAAKRATEMKADVAVQDDHKRRLQELERLLQAAAHRENSLRAFIKDTGSEREEYIRRGAEVMREKIAKHIRTHPDKALGSEIANHIMHRIDPPTIDEVTTYANAQEPDDGIGAGSGR